MISKMLPLVLAALLLNAAAFANETIPADVQSVEQPSAAIVAQPAAPAVDPLTGQVQQSVEAPAAQPQATVLSAADYLEIRYTLGSAKYKLKEYNLVVNNKQAKHVELLQVEVVNGLTEQAYLEIQQQKSQAKRRVAGGILRGVTGIATSFVPYAGIGSMAAYQALNVGNQVAYHTANAMENSAGSVDYNGRVVQRAANVIVGPNQPFQCLAVVPEGQQPNVRVIFKDLQTNQIYDLQK